MRLPIIITSFFIAIGCGKKASFDTVSTTEKIKNDDLAVEDVPQEEKIRDRVTIPEVKKCAAGESLLEDGTCIQSVYNKCEEFVEINLGTNTNLIQIPSLKSSGKCYYKKIINERTGRNKSLVAKDVLSDNHTRSNKPHNPWILGEFSRDFLFQGNRKISLAGDFAGDINLIKQSPVRIDNFLLIKIKPENDNPQLLARGTGDSLPIIDGKRQPIQVNTNWPSGNPVWEDVTDFEAYAKGGVASVPTLDFSTSFEINKRTNIQIRMLDCGGGAKTSDVYLIIH